MASGVFCVWREDPPRPALAAAGWCLLASGVALRFGSRRALGRFFSCDTVIREDHRLVDSGPYALARHPLSVGMLLEAAAAALLGGSWWLAGPWALLALAFAVRNSREERRLIAHFGEPYERYRRSVPGMNLPWGLARYLLRRGRPTWRAS